MKILTSLYLAVAILSPATLFAQAGPTQSEIHRSLSSLESELLAIIDRKEQIVLATENRYKQINELTQQRNRADANERTRLSVQIENFNNQNRIASTEINKLNLNSERIRIEIDRLMRFEQQFAPRAGAPTGGNRAPTIRSITVVRTDRKGPMRVPGRGNGFMETTIYEVVFSDSSRQRVEDSKFIPQR